MKLGHPLKDKTTLRIGGKASFYSQPQDIEELRFLVTTAAKLEIPVHILGAGSNILVSDKGVKGLVISLASPGSCVLGVRGGCRISASAGVSLKHLMQLAQESSLSGFEFLAGIPGTVGGALAMNAGCWGSSILERVVKVRVMDYKGRLQDIDKSEIRPGYRESNLNKFIIISALFSLKKGEEARIKKLTAGYLRRRRVLQDNSFPNAGCVFKNPDGSAAGRLIDLCGLKGKSVGRALISRKHANFILNRGGASSRDVLRLMDMARSAVRRKFNVRLEPEIKIWS